MTPTLITSAGKLLSFFFFSVALLTLNACTTLTSDIEIETHADPEVNYNAYKTYAWAGSAQILFDPVGQWEQPTLDTDEEVRFVINRELRARGMTQVDRSPDLLVAFAAGVDTSILELKEDPESDKKIPTNVPKAALVIALIDANTGYAVWLGYAVGDAQQQQSSENIKARINYAVSEIFDTYNK